MATTYQAISSVTVGAGGAATISFTNIPQTYTDLLILYSCRSSDSATNWNNMKLSFNGSTADGVWRYLAMYNAGMAEGSGGQIEVWINFNGSSGNSFSNSYVYITDYAVAASKNVLVDTAAEGNAQDQILGMVGGLWNNNAAITSITATPSSGSFMQYSSATLYGISKS